MEIKNLTIEIAAGTASAKMKQGSFRHRDRIRGRRSLELSAVRDTETGSTCSLRDPLTGTEIQAVLQRMESAAEGVSIQRLRISGLPAGINRIWVSIPASAGECIMGCGEIFSEVNLKGHTVRIWVAEHQNSKMIIGKLRRELVTGPRPERKVRFERYESYYAQPTFVSNRGAFVHVDGGSYMEFDFSKADRTVLMMRGNADIYFGQADQPEGISKGISELTGRQPRIPDYLLDGVIVASQRGTEVLEQKLAAAQEYDIPVAGFWCQDWCGCRETGFGYQVMWNWQWDRTLYPDLPERIADWKSRGVSFFGYINPFLAIEGPLYAEASREGYCVRNRLGEDYMVTITTFPAAMIDFTNPDAWEWYKTVIRRELIGIGMAGWMADFGEYLPPDAVLYSGAAAEEMHNLWPALWAELNEEAIRESGKECFFFVRAGHTGTISHAPMVWNGDQHVDWSDDMGIGSVIPASLSLAVSGVGLCHSDLGGYTSIFNMKRSRELLMRWAELCCFSPIMRMHEGNRPNENVQFDHDPEVLRHISAMVRLHRKLLPYLRSALEEYYRDGLPLMRPLWYYYQEEGLAEVRDAYLLGRDILVAPVIRAGTRQRICRLPEDHWVHILTGREYSGGICEVDAPLGCPPVWIRKDSPFAEGLVDAVGRGNTVPCEEVQEGRVQRPGC